MKKRFAILFPVVLGLCFSLVQADEHLSPPEALQVIGLDPSASVTYHPLEEGKLLVSVTDAREKQVQGLTQDFFTIRQAGKKARITSFEPLATSKELPLNIVMVIDNSKSMLHRQAVQPLTAALEAFFKTLRPIDTVMAVMFDEGGATSVNGVPLRAKVLKTSDRERLRAFTTENLSGGLTDGTYLYDAVAAGLAQVRDLPEKSNKIMVIFSDGEDINSTATQADLDLRARDIPNFRAFAVDYMPVAETDPYLSRFAANHGGRIWKASRAEELLPAFEAFSSILLHRYVLTYRFNQPPQGTIGFATPQLTIEEVTTIDSAPLLNHVYFDTNRGELPNRYALFKNTGDTEAFSEKNLKSGMEKYTQVLNIVGARLKANPEAAIRLVGCNADVGPEKGRIDLSRSRAEAVQAYLRYIWGIDPQRMTVEPRNLPPTPSSSRIPEGQAENQRVEIHSDHPAILDTVNSEYTQMRCDQEQLRIVAQIGSEAGIADWRVVLACAERPIQTFSGQGPMPPHFDVPLSSPTIETIAACGDVRATVAVVDNEGNALRGEDAALLPLRIARRTEQTAQVQGLRVKEQYALILFDFDKADIRERNQVVAGRIIERLEAVPSAQVSIIGHTDTIGKEEYNLALSRRRAEAVQKTLLQARGGTAGNWLVEGVGPGHPLYDNLLPEGRALNRTVTITLEYLRFSGGRP